MIGLTARQLRNVVKKKFAKVPFSIKIRMRLKFSGGCKILLNELVCEVFDDCILYFMDEVFEATESFGMWLGFWLII